MLRMEQIEAIKRMSRSESISTIASALNIDWKTAKKYAEMDDFNVTVETKVAMARASKLDPYKPTIDMILEDEEQRRVPRKQRFTTKRMHSSLGCDLRHDELKDSHPSDMMWFLLLARPVTDQGKSSVSIVTCHSSCGIMTFSHIITVIRVKLGSD